ncbi:hypothetical protein OVW19_28445, partial [Klebsiella pneumoniae]|nr:hypothetical protein [Klebsiella pneumoniae]
PVGGTIDVHTADDDDHEPIALRSERVEALLGAAIPQQRQSEILVSLGFDVAPAGDALEVRVPHWRQRDITREADLIEEVARINGIETLP